MKTCKCHVCGKVISSGRSLDPDPDIPEIKEKVYFCGTRCLNSFVGSIKRKRTKSVYKEIRNQLKNADHEPSEKETSLLLRTLAPNERALLTAIGVGVMLAGCKTLKSFYQELNKKLK